MSAATLTATLHGRWLLTESALGNDRLVAQQVRAALAGNSECTGDGVAWLIRMTHGRGTKSGWARAVLNDLRSRGQIPRPTVA